MAKVHTAGVPAQRWLAIGFVTVTVLAVVPLGLFKIVSGQAAAPAGTLPVPAGASTPTQAATPVADAVTGRVDAHTLLAILRDHDISLDKVRSGEVRVPRLVMSGMPRGIDRLASIDDRKDAFVNTMLPLVLMVNEEITRDRVRLEGLASRLKAHAPLTPEDSVWLRDLARRYGVTRDDASVDAKAPDAPVNAKAPDAPVDVDALIRRVDIVPVSMVLAQAAEESGWGTSRVAQHANALFGQLTWDPGKGIAPRNRQTGETYRYRRFDDLLQSVREYEQNLNTHDAYAKFRATRAALRRKGQPLDSLRLISTLDRYSEKGVAYVKSLATLVRVNDLRDFDQAELHQESPNGPHVVIEAALKRK